MRCLFDNQSHVNHPDPYIFFDEGTYYLYTTADAGAAVYTASAPEGPWHYEGFACQIEGRAGYWAPCIHKHQGKFYLYFSCMPRGGNCGVEEHLFVAEADSPLGPFVNAKKLYDYFSIDAHVVETASGLFLFYVKDDWQDSRFGSRLFVDRLLDPTTPAYHPVQVLAPSLPEEMFRANRFGDGRDWYTLEGPFWFREGDWQYLIYSGACFENDTYHLGYAVAPAKEEDLTKVTFTKHTLNGTFDPLLFRCEYEEGTGHNSVIQTNGEYYLIYHGRDIPTPATNKDSRSARICRLHVNDGILTAERYPDRL